MVNKSSEKLQNKYHPSKGNGFDKNINQKLKGFYDNNIDTWRQKCAKTIEVIRKLSYTVYLKLLYDIKSIIIS